MLRSAARILPFGVALLVCAGLVAQGFLSGPPAGTSAAVHAEAAAEDVREGGLGHRIFEGILALALSPDAQRVASVDADGRIRLWDLASRAELRSLSAHPAAATGIAFSPDGELLLSVGRDSVVRVWRADDLESVVELGAHEHPIRAIAASEAAGLVATAGDDTRVMLWDLRTHALRAVLTGHRDSVNGLAMSADGACLAAAGADGRILVWDLRDDAPRLLHTLRGHAAAVNAVAFAAGDRLIASASDDATVKLWDVEAGLQIRSLAGHAGPVRSLALDAGRKWLAGAADDEIRVWDFESGTLLRILPGDGSPINSLLVTPGGRILAGDAQRGIVEWDVLTGSRVDLLPPAGSRGTASSAADAAPVQAQSAAHAPVSLVERFLSWLMPAAAAATLPVPDVGPGGPILVITAGDSPFETFYPEILRNEGFNAFAVRDIDSVDAATLAAYDVVLLAEADLSGAQVTLLSDWVTAGGNLIAMRPDAELASLLGISSTGTTQSDGYLRVDVSGGPGYGIAAETLQYHGSADRYTLAGATALATLYSDAATATSNPAVTLRSVGASGGQAAAFAYDLARSIVYTRQGNPTWEGQERDGFNPIRSDDLFFGNAAGDPQPDWIDRDKVAIPQADEQQRLLANLIVSTALDRIPLPRFWYFPRGERAVLVMTGDDHANNGTTPRFQQFLQDSPAGCSVDDWECIRGTSYIYPNTPITPLQAQSFEAQGFEVGLHINTGCGNYTPSSLASTYAVQIADFAARFPGIPAPSTMRHHCIVWSDWSTGAEVQLANGIRLDTSYYYWPAAWVENRPGYFTGSAMPMRFSALDGELIDVYQAATQMTDESGQPYPFTVDSLFDWALGPEERYGALVINAHTDVHPIVQSTTAVASALARNVPVITSRQLLEWLDGRNSSSFESISWAGGELSFDVTADAAANGIQALVPWVAQGGVVVDVLRDGSPIAFSFDAVKGVAYARLAAGAGSYTVVYGADTTPPGLVPVDPADGAGSVNPGVRITARFSEGMDPESFQAADIELQDGGGAPVAVSVAYRAFDQTLEVVPQGPLQTDTTHTVIVRGGVSGPTDLAGNPLPADATWSFTTIPAPDCPCSVWTPSEQPLFASDPDPSAVEVGMRFRADFDGYVTGVRFYKGTANTGTHVGNLWTAGGTQLATATFTSETASGWQQVDFASPVVIFANTEYVVSYFAPNGRYASDPQAFASAGIDRYPLHVPASSGQSPNGMYRYGAASQFPTESFLASNYWVDVVFDTTAPPDLTPPSVTDRSPADGAIDVSVGTTVSATFSEVMNAGSINPATVRLRDAGGAIVAASLSYDVFANTATLTPAVPLAAVSLYTFEIVGGPGGVADFAGNPLPADAFSTFITAAPPTCPCSGFDPTDVPANPSEADPLAVEVGVKFRTDVAGFVTGVRFYKGIGNTGTHVGHVWTSGGVLLATATFTGETPTGWQEVAFGAPVPVTAGSVYVASYHAPNGNYAADGNYFTSSGVDNPPVRLLENGESGGNGVFTYTAIGAFPTSSYLATNYWVDVVFSADDGLPPTVVATQPVSAAGNVPAANAVSATFSESMDPATISAATFELRNALGASVPGSVSYDEPTRTATFVPAAGLPLATTFVATIVGGPFGVLDVYGVPLAESFVWPFTTVEIACCSAWTPADAPTVLAHDDGAEVELGVKFKSDVDGAVKGIRFYKGSGNTGTHVGSLWTLHGTKLGTAVFTNETPTGWQQVDFATPIPIARGGVYIASYRAPNGNYAADQFFFQTAGVDRPPLHLLKNGVKGGNGTYAYGFLGNWFPSQSYRATNYWVDVVFSAENGLVPTVVATQPPSGSANVAVGAPVRATFSEAMHPATISAATFALRNAAGTVVPGSVSYDPGARTATFDPAADLVFGATYTATVVGGAGGVLDSVGHPLASDVVWSFTTVAAPDCCSIWTPLDVPAVPARNDSAAVEAGVKFRSDVSGAVTGVRFYKGSGNTGTHVGNVWTLTGVRLATATFTGETAIGWQQVDFATPVPIAAGVTYIASYHAPNGHYAGDQFFFQSAGVDNPPLHLLQDGVSGGNGVFGYTATSGFPSQTFRSTNYWVDVVFATSDGLPPLVVGTSPEANQGGVAPAVAAVSATFSKSVDPATITSATFELRDAGGALVPAAVGYDDPSRTASLVLGGDLAFASTYTATLRGGPTGVRDLSGQPLAADYVWSFTTATEPMCCSVWSDLDVPSVPSESDPGPVELGVKFRADVNGFITGARFYKGAGNTGTHVGNLWTSSGTLLTSATFTGETATGWQQVAFAEPVPIAANVVYVVSYFAPNGHYAADSGFFAAAGVDNPPLHLLQNGVSGGNGVFAYAPASTFPNSSFAATNYWVDPVFTTDNGLPPVVALTFPSGGAVGVPVGTTVQAIFSEAMDPATISAASFELRAGDGSLVPAAVSYDGPTLAAVLTPGAPLEFGATYTARIFGGGSGPRDLQGNPLATDAVWSFTTVLESECCSVWSPFDVPANPSENDPNATELGVKFRSDQAGFITAVRFYKGSGNIGTHVGNLWLADGTLLASADFTGESPTGWQQVTFPTPVPIAADVTYVASYFAPNGSYAADEGYFSAAGVDVPPLHLLQDGVDGPNGMFRYSPTSAFPTSTFNASNYWVDVVFTADNPTEECQAPPNDIVAENCLAGNPPSEWEVSGIGDPSIQGYATEISVDRGATVDFKIDTDAGAYRLDIYRLGFYGGFGARRVDTVIPSAALPQSQPACDVDPSTGLVDCGDWSVSASWSVPPSATSGIYIARAVRTDTDGASHIVFVVRDDTGGSDLLFQTADTTWQAYNNYGGNSLYQGAPVGRAYKVSYNRPFYTRTVDNGQDWLFNSEYPMVRWLEANGYDVSYTTGVDIHRQGAPILNHAVFLSIGHDEYWSHEQRANVEAARDAGVHLAFFSGNEVFWKTRWEDAERTLVCYKETHDNGAIDPEDPPIWTGTWRDPRFSPPGDGGRPENELTGQLFTVNDGATTNIRVPTEDGRMRFWRNTSIASLPAGSTAGLAPQTLGYEWDEDIDNGFRPAGLIRLSTTTVFNAPVLQDFGSNYASGTAVHHLTLYRAASGALVFGAGTVQWPWGLDSTHDRGNAPVDVRMQQATVNLFADMGVEAATLQSSMLPASASSDLASPTSVIVFPASGATLGVGSPVTITGTSADTGGGAVGGVEVSVDNGATWHPADGRESWSYTWTPIQAGPEILRVRAADDSVNLEVPGAGIGVTVQ